MNLQSSEVARTLQSGQIRACSAQKKCFRTRQCSQQTLLSRETRAVHRRTAGRSSTLSRRRGGTGCGEGYAHIKSLAPTLRTDHKLLRVYCNGDRGVISPRWRAGSVTSPAGGTTCARRAHGSRHWGGGLSCTALGVAANAREFLRDGICGSPLLVGASGVVTGMCLAAAVSADFARSRQTDLSASRARGLAGRGVASSVAAKGVGSASRFLGDSPEIWGHARGDG